MWSGDDIYFMKRALEEAEEADRRDEVPIGAILVQDGQILASGHNAPITSHDPTAHAEVRALRSAGEWLRNYRMPGATLYVTLEPCLMCYGALMHARVARVIYGASDPKVGMTRWACDLRHANFNHEIQCEGGLLEEECREQLQAFFRRRRG
jgi:tRNA(adenine34) deaminase